MKFFDTTIRTFLAVSSVSLGIAAPLAHAETGTYLSNHDVDLTQLLAPPPAANSNEQKVDIAAVLKVQHERTAADVAAGIADVQKSVFRFNDVLGPDFNQVNLPKLSTLFDDVNKDASLLTSVAKNHFHRARPYVASDEVHPTVPEKEKGKYQSYPSGHATMGYLDAILLADMVPEKRDAIFARGRKFGDNRVVDGVHYPTDVEAARIDATVIASALMHNPKFLADYEVARLELRRTLHLQ